ncbi:hypothetical protein [Caenimonas koreensis]|uniref:hypothetical protein n=1 Tax=Caenimonas koreensis TaxID=367474 RepID=UPI003784C6EF
MNARRTAGFAIVAALVCGIAHAQSSALSVTPAVDVSCLTSLDGPAARPVYPEGMYALKQKGLVRVAMEFTGPDTAPTLKSISQDDEAFLPAVRRHVERLRLPCMKPGSPPAQLSQEYVFVPNDGRKVAWTSPELKAGDGASPGLACVAHVVPGSKPEMPRRAIRENHEGSVIGLVRFTGKGVEPEVSLAYPGPYAELAATVVEFMKGYRQTCDAPPFVAKQMFQFRIEPSERIVLRDTTLASFLRGASNATAVPVYFDLDGMKCPFDVRLEYWQPTARNRVGEVGEPVAQRRPFLDWLSTLKIRMSADVEAKVLGDSLTVSVPCGKVDL